GCISDGSRSCCARDRQRSNSSVTILVEETSCSTFGRELLHIYSAVKRSTYLRMAPIHQLQRCMAVVILYPVLRFMWKQTESSQHASIPTTTLLNKNPIQNLPNHITHLYTLRMHTSNRF
ncbi:hypothetical protein ACTXT7_017542, partial [Hymenolepis weldensis]